jgi:predicted dehydrogenase
MRVLLVGLGSIGRRHLGNLRRLLPSADVTVWRRSPPGSKSGGGLAAREGLPEGADRLVFGLEDALATRPDLAIVAGPASTHVEIALPLAEAGVHLFVEKPIADRLAGVDELIRRCRARGRVLMVGYTLRFYPPLRRLREALRDGVIGRPLAVEATVGQYLPDWRPRRDYRDTVSARAELGGGAVLELSHEIDYVRWLTGEVVAVTGRVARLGDLAIDVEDSADFVMECDTGVMANLHLDMLQRAPTRRARVIGTDGTLELDLIRHELRRYTAASGAWSTLLAAPRLDFNEVYLDELGHFLACVEAGTVPLVTATDARRVLEIALAVKRASAEGRRVTL